ncbi:hypothetical protein ABEH87_12440 [Erwinia sp. Eh17-17]|uniref:hypothetical protein n=1 Tax=Erwinia sp. Eh17-17 TaxID=3080330 RepID=UPI003207F3EE
MHNKFNLLVIYLPIFFVSACSSSIDRTLSPPADTKWVSVEVKNPLPYTKPFPLEARYISHKCQKKRVSGFDGSVITEPSYNGRKVPLQQQGSSDVWQARVAMTGGGSCDWTLSAVSLGIEYIDATHLGKDLVPGTAVGAIIAFDNDASRNGQFSKAKGKIVLKPNYYPYILEWNLGERKKELSLLGETNFISLKVHDSNEIEFNPKIDERKVVRYVGIEKKTKGIYSKIIYPDGSVAPEKTLFPDFRKVDEMQLK